MIKGLEIHNFQSHEETTLSFDPGVNVIVGSSDCGKTAIMRALRYVCTNKPRGEGFRSHWGGETIVTLEVDDVTITRYKDKENIYFLEDTEFRAFGNDVPEEIVTALNLDEDVNIQKQLDTPYLIPESAGYVAQHFNKMAHLEKIDLGNKNTQTLIRTAEASIKTSEASKKSKEEELVLTYGFLPTAENLIISLEKQDTEIQRKKAEISRLKELVQLYKETKISLFEARKITGAATSVEELLTKEVHVTNKTRSYNILSDVLEALSDRATSILVGKSFIKPEKVVLLLLKKTKVLEVKGKSFSAFEDTLIEYEETEKNLKTEKKSVTSLEEEYVTRMPEECPLCNTKL